MRKEEKMRLGCFRDKTYCASPDCQNKCGRKMSAEIESILKADKYGRTSWAYFCGEPEVVPIDISRQVIYTDTKSGCEHE